MTTGSKFAGRFRDGIGDTKCVGCHEPLDADQRARGYCSRECRRVARVMEKGLELDALAESTKRPEDYEAADAKWLAAAELGAKIRGEPSPCR